MKTLKVLLIVSINRLYVLLLGPHEGPFNISKLPSILDIIHFN